MPGEPDPRYIIARRTLLDVLEAFEVQRRALIVVGAQAIYLHTGEADVGLAPYTTDGDLVLDVDALIDEPTLSEIMERAGFRRGQQPGCWISGDGIVIDLHVPASLGGTGRRGARLGPHGNVAARKARGLEAAIVDRAPQTIRAFDADDRRVLTVDVAGPAALLVSKMQKIAERERQLERSDDKDAHDVYRLLRGIDAQVLASGVKVLLAHQLSARVTAEALEYLDRLFGRPRGVGCQMVVRAAGGGGNLLVDAETVAASCAVLATDLLASTRS